MEWNSDIVAVTAAGAVLSTFYVLILLSDKVDRKGVH